MCLHAARISQSLRLALDEPTCEPTCEPFAQSAAAEDEQAESDGYDRVKQDMRVLTFEAFMRKHFAADADNNADADADADKTPCTTCEEWQAKHDAQSSAIDALRSQLMQVGSGRVLRHHFVVLSHAFLSSIPRCKRRVIWSQACRVLIGVHLQSDVVSKLGLQVQPQKDAVIVYGGATMKPTIAYY